MQSVPIPAQLVHAEALRGAGVLVPTDEGPARARVRRADGKRGVAFVISRHGDLEIALTQLTIDDTTRHGRASVLRDVAFKLGWVVPLSQIPNLRRIPVGNAWILSLGDRQQVWSAGTDKRPGLSELATCRDDVAGHVRAARAIWWSLQPANT